MTASRPGAVDTPIPTPWPQAGALVHAAGRAALVAALEAEAAAASAPAVPGRRVPGAVPLAHADGFTLAQPLMARTALPPFPTASVDGWAVRGDGPWRIAGQVLAGESPEPLTVDGTCLGVAMGAHVPIGATALVRIEDSTIVVDVAATPGGADARLVAGTPRVQREWREVGDEAACGETLLPAGTPVDPTVIGLAAACGYDRLQVQPAPEAAVIIVGDELESSGVPSGGRIRDSLGPSLAAWLRRLGAAPLTGFAPYGTVPDTLEGHRGAIRAAFDAGATVVVTTGGTMRGPVDHVHAVLVDLGMEYLVNTVSVRPGYPMLAARSDDGRFLLGLPGNPHAAVVALMTLAAPLLAGLTGRPAPEPARIRLPREIPGRLRDTHLALVDSAGRAVDHSGSAMLRGLAAAAGFAVIPAGSRGRAGDEVPLVRLPLLPGERP